MMCNGMLAGLVAITCPCAFVSAGGASASGLVAGILVVESVFFFDKIGIDDCVGAISVHGVNGAWGCLSLGLFADGTYGDGWNGVAGNGHRPLLRRRHGPVLGRAHRRHRLLRHAVRPLADRLLDRRGAGRQPRQQGSRDRRPRPARDGRPGLLRRRPGQGGRDTRHFLSRRRRIETAARESNPPAQPLLKARNHKLNPHNDYANLID